MREAHASLDPGEIGELVVDRALEWLKAFHCAVIVSDHDGQIVPLAGRGLSAGLSAAAQRLPFLPIRAGLGSDVLLINPELRTVRSPYGDAEELVAMPALRLDAALVHLNRADRRGNGQYLGPDPYFDDLFCAAADRRYVSCERLVETAELLAAAPAQSLLLNRSMVDGVVVTPGGAHFTSCVPDYGRDELFQHEYAASATSPEAWRAFRAEYLAGDEDAYQNAVQELHARRLEEAVV